MFFFSYDFYCICWNFFYKKHTNYFCIEWYSFSFISLFVPNYLAQLECIHIFPAENNIIISVCINTSNHGNSVVYVFHRRSEHKASIFLLRFLWDICSSSNSFSTWNAIKYIPRLIHLLKRKYLKCKIRMSTLSFWWLEIIKKITLFEFNKKINWISF